ncbi:hypothetical protein HYT51_01400 [Candidatus Woesearchaeota archaeon]|nr:hypothetical protein [Candidatus Woesearchaeota archaeon]
MKLKTLSLAAILAAAIGLEGCATLKDSSPREIHVTAGDTLKTYFTSYGGSFIGFIMEYPESVLINEQKRVFITQKGFMYGDRINGLNPTTKVNRMTKDEIKREERNYRKMLQKELSTREPKNL